MGKPFFPKLCPKVTCLCWLERRIHSMANCGRIRAVDNGSVGQQPWMGHVGHGSVPWNTWL